MDFNSFLSLHKARLNDEQGDVVSALVKITSATTAREFIDASLPLLERCGVRDQKQEFIDAVFENFDEMRPPSVIPVKDHGIKLYHMLRGSKPPVNGFLSSFCVVTPHSMTVEKCVSTYNILYSDLRMATGEQSLNDRLLIHWNGVPTAKFDPRPPVESFLSAKERRMKLPNVESFKGRDFVKKFFL